MDDFVHEVRPNVRRIGDKDRKKGPVRCVQNVIMAYMYNDPRQGGV